MEFKRAQEIAVVLTPAIFCATLWFASGWIEYIEWTRRFFSSQRKIEWLREIITHVMLYGVAAASGFGIAKDSGTMLAFAGAWFLGSIWLGYQLSCLPMTGIMIIGLIGISRLKAGNRELQSKILEKREKAIAEKRANEVQPTS